VKKWLRVLIAVVYVVAVLAIPLTALASEVADITITATPIFTAGIINFQVTYINDQRLDFSWGYGIGATKIMIRAKYGDYPSDIPDESTTPTDGYEVYYGNGVTASDTSVDFDQSPGPIYIKAWGQKADGTWYTTADTGQEEGMGMTLLALSILALGLTAAMFATKNMMLGFPCVIFWGVMGGYSYTRSSTTWDWQYLLFFAAMGMAIFSAIAMYALRKRDLDPPKGDYLDSGSFIDEGPSRGKGGQGATLAAEPEEYEEYMNDDMDMVYRPSKRTKELHARAAARRSGQVHRKDSWGEFK